MLLIMVEELLEHILFAAKSGVRAGLLLSKSARMSRQVKRAAQTHLFRGQSHKSNNCHKKEPPSTHYLGQS
jgi:hypothetical protein